MTTTQHDKDTSNSHISSEEPCVFCKIVKGEIPAVKLYEDDETLAFLDIRRVNPGHTLVIPKDHFENIYTVPLELWCRVSLTAQKLAVSIKNGTDADGINLRMNNESAAGQDVPHAHIHIIPRLNEDGLLGWPQEAYKDTEEMTAVAEKIRAELKS